MKALFDKVGLRDLRRNGASSLTEPEPERKTTVALLTFERDDLQIRLEYACDRIFDMLQGDDGQAWSEAERFLKREAPGLYDRLGMPDDFPEPSLIDKACGVIVGLLIRKPRK